MFREMRRSDKQLPEAELLEIMGQGDYGVLSTVGEDGFPYGVPLNYVYQDGFIYFHSAREGHKVDNLAYSHKASFCVICDVENMPDEFNTKFRSVIAFGEVSEVATEEDKQPMYELLMEKYSKDFYEAGMEYIKDAGAGARVYRMKVMHMVAKGKK